MINDRNIKGTYKKEEGLSEIKDRYPAGSPNHRGRLKRKPDSRHGLLGEACFSLLRGSVLRLKRGRYRYARRCVSSLALTGYGETKGS